MPTTTGSGTDDRSRRLWWGGGGSYDGATPGAGPRQYEQRFLSSSWGLEMTVRAVLDQVNVVVDDMEAMVEFYGRLGLRLGSGLPQWAPHHRETEPEGDGFHLALDSRQFAAVWDQGWRGGGGIVLGFRVPSRQDVDGLYDELTSAGYSGQQAPYDAFWGARYAVVSDPDGNAVGLMSPADAAFQLPPPSPPD